MAKTLILLLLSLVVTPAQQVPVRAQQSSVDLHRAAVKGDKTAFEQLRTRAERQNAEAQLYLGSMYARGDGVPKDAAQGVVWYRKAAEQGYAPAQTNLGLMYDLGEGVSKDSVSAVAWYRKAAQQGDARAQTDLGMNYAIGQGVPKDAVEAVNWIRKAAEQGYAPAQYDLGLDYLWGSGVPSDPVQAVNWIRKAAEQGDATAQYNLGKKYDDGEGVPKDAVQAATWYRKAAEQGHALAQYTLGLLYIVGNGVPKDLVASYMWLNLAATEGGAFTAPKEIRDKIELIMTPAQIAEAQRLSREHKTLVQGEEKTQNVLDATNAKRVVPMLQEGGVYKVPVLINDAITLNFVVDSGAADVSIPEDVVTTLMRTGTITQSDFVGARNYTLADGSTRSSRTLRIRSLKVGDIVLQDVMGSVTNREGDLLLGQSFLGHFKSWSIDNPRHALVLE